LITFILPPNLNDGYPQQPLQRGKCRPSLDHESGATAFGPFLVRSVENGIGFSDMISTGNEADLDFTDFARYLLDDPDTQVIAGFVEGFKQADKISRSGKARSRARQAEP
jgi:acyl-CoA synthetase (NDP forming)